MSENIVHCNFPEQYLIVKTMIYKKKQRIHTLERQEPVKMLLNDTFSVDPVII